jgi:hypothetical protein
MPPRGVGQTLELGREPSSSTRMGMIDEWPVPDAPEAADDWLDDFADVHPSSAKVAHVTDRHRIPTPVHEFDDDPRTIPPEALERILESGPLDIEVQESFMLLDSRDQRVAFQAAETVAMAGEAILEGLAAMFPGRLFVDRYQFTGETLPSVGDHGPVLRALVRLGSGSLPVVRTFIDHTSPEARFYAVFLLTQISAEGLLPHLLPRLFDRDQQIRQITRSIALSYQNAPNFGSAILEPLHERLKLAQDELQVDVCTEVLTRLRNVDAIPLLIEQLGRHREHTNRNVHQALQVLTLHNWSSPYEWKHWWSTAQYEKRQVWLIAAMDAQNDGVRQMALEELQRVPGLETAYHPDQPSKLRQREQRVVEKWFSEHP